MEAGGHTLSHGREQRLPISIPAAAALTVGVVLVIGVLERIAISHQTLFSDELSTYWISSTHTVSGIWSLLGQQYRGATAEISPPLYFLLAWVPLQIAHTGEMLRAPSLIAGVLTVPVVYLIGRRTIGQAGGALAAVLAMFSPFGVYFSAEARPYAVMMLLVALSTLSLLEALRTHRRSLFAVYALASCGAMYAHYTCVFVLAGQLGWALLRERAAWRSLLLANAGAVLLYVPWLSSLGSQQASTTTSQLSKLSPFTPDAAAGALSHWAMGDPVSNGVVKLTQVPGNLALVLLGTAVVASVADISAARFWSARNRSLVRSRPTREGRIGLLVVLALSTLVGEAFVSAISTHLLTARNLAASWPGLMLCLAALIVTAQRVRIVSAMLAVGSFALGSAKMLDQSFQRPDFRQIAAYIDAHAGPADAVIDESVLFTPAPIDPLDYLLRRRHLLVRVGDTSRAHPFDPRDRFQSYPQAVKAAEVSRPSQIILAGTAVFPFSVGAARALQRSHRLGAPIPGYRETEQMVYPGIAGTLLVTYSRTSTS